MEKSNKSSSILSSLPVLALIILAFMVGYLINEVKNLKSNKVANVAALPGGGGGQGGGSADGTAAPAGEHLLSVGNLKKYAKELGMDSNTFDKCLDSGDKSAQVKADAAQGSTLGVRGTPGFFVNGRFLGGAFPFESFKEIIDMELAGKGSANLTAYSANLQDAAKQQAFDPKPKVIDIGTAPVLGNPNAPITLVEFTDFECPFCVRAFPTMKTIIDTYKDKVKVVSKHFPLDFHPQAQKAAEASLCANDQGKFWELHDKMFTVQAN